MLYSLNGYRASEPALGHDEKVHESEMSEPGAAFFFSEPFDEGIVDFSAGHKVFSEHQENALSTEVINVIRACCQVLYKLLGERVFDRNYKHNFTRNVKGHFFLLNLVGKSQFLSNFDQVIDGGLVAHSDKLAQHTRVETDRVNGEVLNEGGENVIFLRVGVQDKVKDFVSIGSDTHRAFICENGRVNLSLLFLQVFIMRTRQDKLGKFLVTGQEPQHDFLVLFGVTGKVVAQRLILVKLKLLRGIKVVGVFVNKHFCVVVSVFETGWVTAQIPENQKIRERPFHDGVRHFGGHFFKEVEPVDDMEESHLADVKQLSDS